MDHDAAAIDCRGGISIFISAYLVVIDDGVNIVLVPNLDAEQVHVSTGREFLVDGADHKLIVAGAVDGAHTLEHSLFSATTSQL